MSDVINLKDFYNQEARVTIIENAIFNIDRRFDGIEKRFDKLDYELKEIKEELKGSKKELKDDIRELKGHMRGNLFWTLGCILGLYGTALVTLLSAVGKAYHWF